VHKFNECPWVSWVFKNLVIFFEYFFPILISCQFKQPQKRKMLKVSNREIYQWNFYKTKSFDAIVLKFISFNATNLIFNKKEKTSK